MNRINNGVNDFVWITVSGVFPGRYFYVDRIMDYEQPMVYYKHLCYDY